MTRRRGGRPSAPWLLGAAGAGFVAGMVVMSASSRLAPDRAGLVAESRAEGAPAPVSPPPVPSDPPVISADPIGELRKRNLALPVEGLEREDLRDTFDEIRGGDRRHEALDIVAPRDTPVLAVEDGTIAKLFLSKPGGITIYQFDPTSTYAYYYAHLSRYAAGLQERAAVERGQVLGYVGVTGNAPKDTPHLHFAIFKLTEGRQWWKGTPIDPFVVMR